MTTIGRLTKNDLQIIGEVDERLPPITSGLIAHFPFDGRGGTFDAVGGYQADAVPTGVNFADTLEWQDPDNWCPINNESAPNSGMEWDEDLQAMRFSGNRYRTLRVPIVIDTTKTYTVSFDFYVEDNTSIDGYTYRNYIGGHREDENYLKTTNNYDYSIKSSWFAPLQEWQHVEKTYATGDVRYASGWKDEDVGSELMTRYWWFGGLWNYWGAPTSSCLLKNLKITITDADTSNATVTDNHIGIEESTTNLILNGDFTADKAGWYDNQDVTSTVIDIAGTNWVHVVSNQDTSTPGFLHNYMTVEPETTYTFSIDAYKVADLTSAYIYIYGNNGTYIWHGAAIPNESSRISNTFTTQPGETLVKCGILFSSKYIGSWVRISNAQLEPKEFKTSFVDGERASDGQLTIENLALYNFTLAFKFKPDYEYYANLTAAYNRTMLVMYDTDDTRRIDYTDYHSSPPAAASSPFFDLEPNTSWGDGVTNYHYHHNCIYKADEWHDYFITKSGPELKIYVKLAGELLVDVTHSYTYNADLIDFTLSKLTLGSFDSDIWSGAYKDFSIYNRALATTELDKLADNKFSIQSNGDIRSFEIDEQPNGIPIDAYYFPLNENTSDKYGIISPVEEAQLVFEDNAVWVGREETNLASLHSTWSNQRPYTQTVQIPYGTGIGRKFLSGDLTSHWSGNAYGYNLYNGYIGTTGIKYNLSSWVYMSSDCNLTEASINFEVAVSGKTTYDLTKKGTWQLLEVEATATSNDIIRPLTYLTKELQDTDDFNGYVIFSQPMLYAGDFTKPACIGTRTDSSIEFNLFNDIGLDWNSDWSIVYWKKPIGTRNNTMTNYSIESFGCNGNSVGGGYIWWGKTMSSNTIFSSSPGTFITSEYFNNWHAISIVKSGTVITFKEWSIGTDIHIRTSDIGTVTSNYYVNQYGYDFKLGGWDNGNPPNAYYRDLIIVKNALTDEALNSMVNIPMHIYSRLQIQNIIQEVENL